MSDAPDKKDRRSEERAGPNGFTKAELRAGLFVLFALIALAFFYFFAGDIGSMLRPHKRLVACFSDIGGLEVAARVKFAGMEIGKVIDIRIVEGADHKVEAELRVLDDVPLRQGTVASVRATELVIGKYVELSGGLGEAPLLEDGAVIPGSQEPVIDEVINSAGRIILDIGDIVSQVNRVFKEQSAADLMTNLNRMAAIAADPENNILDTLNTAVRSLADAGIVDDIIAITKAVSQNRERIITLVEQGNRLAIESNQLLLDHEGELSSILHALGRLAGAFSGDTGPLAGDLAGLAGNAMTVAEALPGLIQSTEEILAKLDRTLGSLNIILAKTEGLDEEDIRRFLQQEGMRIYFFEKQAPETAEPRPKKRK